MTVKHLDHLNLSVHNVQASAAWYARVFGFVTVESGVQDGRPWRILRSGEAMLAIYEDGARSQLDRFDLARRRLHGVNHYALRITDRHAWLRTVRAEGVTIRYDGEVRWPTSSSWYVTDPTGHEIEVVLWDDDQISFAS